MISGLQIGIYKSRLGYKIIDVSTEAADISFETYEHGYSSCTFFVPMDKQRIAAYHHKVKNGWLQVTPSNGRPIWEGKVLEVTVEQSGISIRGYGLWAVLDRVRYTAMWSDNDYSNWSVLGDDIFPQLSPEKYEYANRGEIYMAARRLESFNTSNFMIYGYQVPDKGLRDVIGVSFDYEFEAPNSTWQASLQGRNVDWSSAGAHWTISGTGVLQTGSVNITFGGSTGLSFRLIYNSGTLQSFTGNTGACFLRIKNLRIVTSSTNRVNTTTATTISAGSQVVTPASMNGIYVGQRLFIDEGLTTSESVIVTAVTASTFTATFVNSYSVSTTIHAHVVYADEIVKELVTEASSKSGSDINSTMYLIESPQLDLIEANYQDGKPTSIISSLCEDGDSDSIIWVSGFTENATLYFRPSTYTRTQWETDPVDISVSDDLYSLENSMYALYKDKNGDYVRSAVSSNEQSEAIVGFESVGFINVNSTIDSVAEKTREAALFDKSNFFTESSISIDGLLFSYYGIAMPKYMVKSGDEIDVRSISPISPYASAKDIKIIGHTYSADRDRLSVIPEKPIPTLPVVVARNIGQ